MGLLSIFQRSRAASTRPAEAGGDAVQQARARARRRLIGAAVLVGVGIIGFPLLFETQPRPVAVDLPIVIPRKDTVPPLALPASRPAPSSQAEAPPSTPRSEPPAARVAREDSEPKASSRAAPEPSNAAVTRPPDVPASASQARQTVERGEAERARALLEGQPTALAKRTETPDKAAPAAAGGSRLVVQVGAFADAGAARQARQRVEKLGIKTYTQEVQTDAGRRIRVRVGPFASRDDADKAAGRIKSAGLPAQVLTL